MVAAATKSLVMSVYLDTNCIDYIKQKLLVRIGFVSASCDGMR